MPTSRILGLTPNPRRPAHLSQRAEALILLERTYGDQHFFIIYLKAEPFFKNFHDEPRYKELLRRVGLTS